MNQNPLASPSAAESHASSVIGAGVDDAAGVESRSPNMETTRTFASLIGRKSQRSGMSAAVRRIVAARSSVRVRQLSSSAQRAA
jgi:hypothetical protein